MDTATTAAAVTPLPICLFGLDDVGKPHASRFTAADLDRATKAAGLMGLHVLALANPESGDLAERLPQGRIFEKSGKAFVPFIARPLYERLAALGGIAIEPVTSKAAKPAKAGAAKADAAAKGKTAKKAAPTVKPEVAPFVEPTNVPQDWPHIRQGSLVLATEGEAGAGWFESTVVAEKGDDLLALQWRDFETPLFLRRRNQLALLPEGTPLKGEA